MWASFMSNKSKHGVVPQHNTCIQMWPETSGLTACYGYASTNISGHVVYINPIYPLNLGDYLNNVLKENAFILPLTPVRLALISKKMYSK